MKCLYRSLAALSIVGLAGLAAARGEPDSLSVGPDDWPWWRGPGLNNVARDRAAVLEWSPSQNIVWKTAVPGRGHASPIVVGERIFLSTADEEKDLQSVLCYERASGKMLWRKDLHQGKPDGRNHRKNTRASSTLASDGERVLAVFHHGSDIWVTALDLEGKQLWQKKVGSFVSHWGYSASPALYRSLVIVATDHKEGGALVALDRASGEVRWQTPRPAAPTYASPIVLPVAGRDQLLIAGAGLVNSYDPSTGKPLWSTRGTSTECVSTILAEGDLVYASGGFPAKETLCIRGDGSGEVVWRVKVGDFVPSQLLHRGYLYAVLDNGMAYCWKASTGEEMWKGRLGGAFSASPILVGEHIYIPSEAGKTYVFRADPQKLEVVAENQLGSAAFATPVACGGRIYLRVVASEGGRSQEMLYCIGK